MNFHWKLKNNIEYECDLVDENQLDFLYTISLHILNLNYSYTFTSIIFEKMKINRLFFSNEPIEGSYYLDYRKRKKIWSICICHVNTNTSTNKVLCHVNTNTNKFRIYLFNNENDIYEPSKRTIFHTKLVDNDFTIHLNNLKKYKKIILQSSMCNGRFVKTNFQLDEIFDI